MAEAWWATSGAYEAPRPRPSRVARPPLHMDHSATLLQDQPGAEEPKTEEQKPVAELMPEVKSEISALPTAEREEQKEPRKGEDQQTEPASTVVDALPSPSPAPLSHDVEELKPRELFTMVSAMCTDLLLHVQRSTRAAEALAAMRVTERSFFLETVSTLGISTPALLKENDASFDSTTNILTLALQGMKPKLLALEAIAQKLSENGLSFGSTDEGDDLFTVEACNSHDNEETSSTASVSESSSQESLLPPSTSPSPDPMPHYQRVGNPTDAKKSVQQRQVSGSRRGSSPPLPRFNATQDTSLEHARNALRTRLEQAAPTSKESRGMFGGDASIVSLHPTTRDVPLLGVNDHPSAIVDLPIHPYHQELVTSSGSGGAENATVQLSRQQIDHVFSMLDAHADLEHLYAERSRELAEVTNELEAYRQLVAARESIILQQQQMLLSGTGAALRPQRQ